MRFPQIYFAPTTSLLKAPASGEVGSICSGQNLTHTRMMIRVQATEGFLRDIHNSQSSSRSLHHIQSSRSCPHPEDVSNPKPHSTIPRPLSLEAFTTSKYSPPQALLESEALLILKTSTLNLKLQQHIILDIHRQLCSSIFPHVHNM